MKRFLSLLMAALLLLSWVSATAETLVLPANLTAIEEEAFYGDTSIDRVVLGNQVQTIGPRAFADSSLSRINLPPSLTAIDNSAFDGPDKVSVSAERGTYAFDWAADHGYLADEESFLLVGHSILHNPKPIEWGVFSYSGHYENLQIPSMIDGDPILYIGSNVFANHSELHSVIIPEGFDHIGNGAFANCTNLTAVYVPSTLTHIGEDAFAGCPNVVLYMDYFDEAYEYAQTHEIKCVVSSMDQYSIGNVGFDEDMFFVEVSTDKECMLQCMMLDEETGEQLYSFGDRMLAGLDEIPCYLFLEPDDPELPEYFEVYAALWTRDMQHRLTAPYHSIRLTRKYAEYMNQTIEDFADHITIDFGNGNFAAMSQGTRETAGEDVRVASDTYTVTDTQAPQVGGILLLDVNGESVPVKVKDVQENADGTYTVQDDPDATLSDFYDSYCLKDNIFIGTEDEVLAQTLLKVASVSHSATFGPVTIDLSGDLSLDIDFLYDKKIFGEDYFEFTCSIKTELEARIECEAKYDSDDDLEFVIYDAPITGIKGLASLNLKVSIPFSVCFYSGGVITGTYTSELGYKYDPVHKGQTIQKNEFVPDIALEAGFEATVVGIKAEVYASLLKHLLKVYINASAGVKIQGKIERKYSETAEQLAGTAKKIHGCDVCLNGTISVPITIEFGITWEISKKCKGDIVKGQVASLDIKLSDFYISIVNDADSLFEGHLHMGLGKCQNYKYRTTLRTQNNDLKEVTGIPVTVSKNGTTVAQGQSPMICYCYPGEYAATADFNGDTASKTFKIYTSEVNVALTQSMMKISGTVTDQITHKPISSVDVDVMRAGELIAVARAEEGYYTGSLPAGDYTFVFSAEGYETKEINVTIVGPSTVDAELMGHHYHTVSFYTQGGDDLSTETVIGVLQGNPIGELPAAEKQDYIFVEYNTSPDGSGEKVTEATVPTGNMTVYAIYVADPQNSDDISVLYFEGHRYVFVDTLMTWNNAKDYCSSLGGHLLTINSEAEQNAITSWLIPNFEFGRIWMGMIRPNFDAWITGEPVTYTNWGNSQPDNAWSTPQECVAMANYFQGSILWPGAWDDWSGPNEYEERFVCEFDNNPVLR